MKRLNENVAYAKSILNKLGISNDSELYNDYLKIREICGVNTGYVGILTKIRFIDNISDMEEIKSIFDILKNSKMNINELNKLDYNDILNIFYDKFNNNKDFELYYEDSTYIYYLVYTYEGILEIGSPSWCLKTKSNWDNYKKKFTHQWVVISKEYKNKLVSPNNDYLSKYRSAKEWVRFGISISKNHGFFNWQGFTDNNSSMELNSNDHTFLGIISTIFNLMNGIKKSYYDFFIGCEKINNYLKINNIDYLIEILKIDKKYFKQDDELYINFSRNYSFYPGIFILNKYSFSLLITTTENITENFNIHNNHSILEILIDYAKRTDSDFYTGIKLKNNLITLDEIKKRDNFITQIKNWLVFDNGNRYLIVDTLENKDYLNFDNLTLNGEIDNSNPQFCWFHKKSPNSFTSEVKEYQVVIDFLIEKEKEKENKSKENKTKEDKSKENKTKGKFIRNFFDFSI